MSEKTNNEDCPIKTRSDEIKKFIVFDENDIEEKIKKVDVFNLNLVTDYHLEYSEFKKKEDAFEDWVQENIKKNIEDGSPTSRAAEESLKKTKEYKRIKREIRKHEEYINFLKDAIGIIKNFNFSIQRYIDRKKFIEKI